MISCHRLHGDLAKFDKLLRPLPTTTRFFASHKNVKWNVSQIHYFFTIAQGG